MTLGTELYITWCLKVVVQPCKWQWHLLRYFQTDYWRQFWKTSLLRQNDEGVKNKSKQHLSFLCWFIRILLCCLDLSKQEKQRSAFRCIRKGILSFLQAFPSRTVCPEMPREIADMVITEKKSLPRTRFCVKTVKYHCWSFSQLELSWVTV